MVALDLVAVLRLVDVDVAGTLGLAPIAVVEVILGCWLLRRRR